VVAKTQIQYAQRNKSETSSRLLEIDDTMRVLCCLLMLCSVLLSGCGESQEDAVATTTTKSSKTVTLDEQSKTTNEPKAAAVVTASKPDGSVALDETTQPTKESQAAAVAAIKKLGGSVQFAEENPGKPVVGVSLSGQDVTDASLVHLKGLTSLQTLDLSGCKVSGAGVKDLQSALPKCRISK
jgi:hypothetical protein